MQTHIVPADLVGYETAGELGKRGPGPGYEVANRATVAQDLAYSVFGERDQRKT